MNDLIFVETCNGIIPVQEVKCLHCMMCCNIDYCCCCHYKLLNGLEDYDVLSQDQSIKETDSGYSSDDELRDDDEANYSL